ncbi:MAG: hypothetical protein MJK12_17525 [Colwellia sp.]|nr:hypothetical protein [Colwellia sp.]
MDVGRIFTLCELIEKDLEKQKIPLLIQQISLGIYAGYPRLKKETPEIFINAYRELILRIPKMEIVSYPLDMDDIKFLESIDGVDKIGFNLLQKIYSIADEFSFEDNEKVKVIKSFKDEFDIFYNRIKEIRQSLKGICSKEATEDAFVKIYFPSGVIESTPQSIYSQIKKFNNSSRLIQEIIGEKQTDLKLIAIKEGSVFITLSATVALGAALAVAVERILNLHIKYYDLRLKKEQLKKIEKENASDENASDENQLDSIGSVFSKLSKIATTHFKDDDEMLEILNAIDKKIKDQFYVELESTISSLFERYRSESITDERKNELSNGFKHFLKHLSNEIEKGVTYTTEFPDKECHEDDTDNNFLNASSYQLKQAGALMSHYSLLNKVVKPNVKRRIENKPANDDNFSSSIGN